MKYQFVLAPGDNWIRIVGETVELMKTSKLFDKNAHVKAIARHSIGRVPSRRVITPKPLKKAKHKPSLEID